MKKYKIHIPLASTSSLYLKNLSLKNQIKFALFCCNLVYPKLEEFSRKEKALSRMALIKIWLKEGIEGIVDKIKVAEESESMSYVPGYSEHNYVSNIGFYAINALNCIINNIVEHSNYIENVFHFTDDICNRKFIILYLDILLNKNQYLTNTKTLQDFAAQDIDNLADIDIVMLLDYVKEEFELDLSEIAAHPRIIAEFIRYQIKMRG